MTTITERRAKVYVAIVWSSVGATITALTLAWTLATRAAETVVAPVREELHTHLGQVQRAMAPGGAMFDRIDRLDDRDSYLVEAVHALCIATPGAPCPSPARLVQKP
jgi:hypothetical protein